MAKKKVDGIIEAVHYGPEGDLRWARAYLRRGPTYTDRVMLDRQALIDQLKSGKALFTGKRIELQASTFEIDQPLRVIQTDGRDVLISGDISAIQDHLDRVPVI